MFAAAAAASAGVKVALLEKNARLGCKMRLTGGGRGNLTNAAPLSDFIDNTPGNGKFLYGALSRFSGADCRRFLREIGVPTKEEDKGRVFPVAEDAGFVVRALEEYLIASGVQIIFSARATGLLIEDNVCLGVTTEPGGDIKGKAVVVATGGVSYPHTGSTGDGYRLARQAGHRITPLSPSLIPLLLTEQEFCRQLQGLSLERVRLTLKAGSGVKPATASGEIVFTHFGLSGPAALQLSRTVGKLFASGQKEGLSLILDLFPDKAEEELASLLMSLASAQPQKSPINAVKKLLPNRLAELICKETRLDQGQKSGETGKKAWRALARRCKDVRLTASGVRPMAEAMVTAGGISLEQVEPGSMASRLVSGLYFAGETLDLDAYSGGFNLQTAFSTGWVAGQAASGFIRVYYPAF